MSKYTKQKTNSHNRVSQYTGVSWNTTTQKWKATITHKRVTYDCGYYSDDREAAKGRDRKIIALGLDKPLQILKPV